MTPTFEDLRAYAASRPGELLTTLHRKKPFSVVVGGDEILITTSNGKFRTTDRKYVSAVLKRLHETGSFSPCDYLDVTFNASYILALVKRWQDGGA